MARRNLWLHKSRWITLTAHEINRNIRTLAAHHSADRSYLLKLRRDTMAMEDRTPWRCGWCWQLRSWKTEECEDCHAHWRTCADLDYAHRGRQGQLHAPKKESKHKPGKGRSTSPHQWNKPPKGKGKRGKSAQDRTGGKAAIAPPPPPAYPSLTPFSYAPSPHTTYVNQPPSAPWTGDASLPEGVPNVTNAASEHRSCCLLCRQHFQIEANCQAILSR